MGDPPLDPKELEAIQEAIRDARVTPERAMSSAAQVDPEEVVPLALIADDRAAETARPAAMRIAQRWVNTARRRIGLFVPGDIEVTLVSAETIDGAALRDELLGSWITSLGPKDRQGPALVAINGPIIETLAARQMGAGDDEEEDDGTADRAPSPTAVSVFAPVGDSVADALRSAWAEEQGCEVVRHVEGYRALAAKRILTDSDVVIAVTMLVSGFSNGRIRLFAKPITFVAPPALIDAVAAPPGAIEEALGGIDIEIKVEFGRARLSMRQVAKLQVGTIIPLDQFIDDLLPVECAGVVKAAGRAVVYRGVLAVEVDAASIAVNRSIAA